MLFFCGIIFLIEIFFWWNYFIGDAFGPGFCGLAKARLPAANQTLRIPIAFLLLVESRSPGRSDFNNQIKPINSFNFISFKLLAKKRGANYASLIYTTSSIYSITIRLDMPNSDTCIK